MFNRSHLILLLAMVLLVPAAGISQVTIDQRFAPGQPPVVIAHRATCGSTPENSLAGIQCAIDRGIDMVEIDASMTRDGQYVLLHDASLVRTTNVRDVFPEGSPNRVPPDRFSLRHFIRDYTLEDIAKLKLRDLQGGDHPVPTLEQALRLANGRLLVTLDLKNVQPDSLAPLLEAIGTENLMVQWETASRLLENPGTGGIAVFSSLETFPDPAARLLELANAIGPNLAMVYVSPQQITPDLLDLAEARGVRFGFDGRFLPIPSPTDQGSDPLQQALDRGAFAVITRRPEALLEWFGR